MKLQKIKSFLQSDYVILAFFSIAFLGWTTGLHNISIPLIAILGSLIFLLCNDMKTVLSAVFYLTFFVPVVKGTTPLVVYGVSLLFGISCLVYFIIKSIKKNKSLTKGKMFWAFIVSGIAFLLGGIYKNFNIVNFVITLAMCVACYAVYWMVINFTTNLKQFLLKLFIFGGLFVAAQILFLIVKSGNIVQAISSRQVSWIGAQNINVACVYLCLGMISCFALGYKTTKDWLYFLLSIFFTLVVYITYCRMMVLITFIIFAVLSIITFIKSKNKKIFLILLSIAVIILALIWLIFPTYVNTLISSLISRGFSGNGREKLWAWCFNKFKQFPIFGVGFCTPEDIPGISNNHSVIFAHNTLLQWLTSIGIVGSVLMIFFYFKKYQIAFKNFNFSKFFLIVNLIMIELSGLTDPAPTMDTFVYIISLILIASLEKDNIETELAQEVKTTEEIDDKSKNNNTEKDTQSLIEKTNRKLNIKNNALKKSRRNS